MYRLAVRDTRVLGVRVPAPTRLQVGGDLQARLTTGLRLRQQRGPRVDVLARAS